MTNAPEDESQRDKFIRTARELGCDEDPKAFERTIRQIVRPKKGEPVPTNRRVKRTATKRRVNEPPESD